MCGGERGLYVSAVFGHLVKLVCIAYEEMIEMTGDGCGWNGP